MWRILLLGAMSGFPWVLIGSALSLWLKEDGLSRSAVGWAGLIFSVYAINFLWAPLIDHIRIPVLTKHFGHRKSWIIFFQTMILIALLGWSMLSPSTSIWMVMACGLLIATASASQDIAIDALRIEQIHETEKSSMAAGAAVAVVGWWSGYKIGGMVTLITADLFEKAGHANYWQLTFFCLCALIVLANIGLIMIPEAPASAREKVQYLASAHLSEQFGGTRIAKISSFFVQAIWGPLSSFFRKNGLAVALALLGFIFLFKIGEAFMGKMSLIFYKEIGFSKSDIAFYSKGIGWITTVGFTLIGGFLAIRSGTVKALFFAGIAMAATNVMFSILAWTGKTEWIFAVAVLLDDIAAAFATVAFVTFISLLVDRTYTATQYAMLASIGTMGRTTLASSSGALVDGLQGDWGLFFIITALMVLPSLILLWFIRAHIPK